MEDFINMVQAIMLINPVINIVPPIARMVFGNREMMVIPMLPTMVVVPLRMAAAEPVLPSC